MNELYGSHEWTRRAKPKPMKKKPVTDEFEGMFGPSSIRDGLVYVDKTSPSGIDDEDEQLTEEEKIADYRAQMRSVDRLVDLEEGMDALIKRLEELYDRLCENEAYIQQLESGMYQGDRLRKRLDGIELALLNPANSRRVRVTKRVRDDIMEKDEGLIPYETSAEEKILLKDFLTKMRTGKL